MRLAARGFSVRQIARTVGAPSTTIQRDLDLARPELRKALADKAEDIYADAAAELLEIRRELWLKYANVPSDEIGLSAAILMDIASLPERRARLGQSLGLVVEAPERVEIVQRLERAMADVLSKFPEEEQDRMIAEIRRAVKK